MDAAVTLLQASVSASPSTEQAFWLTLAATFMAPMRPDLAEAFVTVLADDLEALAPSMGVAADDLVAELRYRAAGLVDQNALLVDYSRCFLPPAGVATLNLSRYVDSGVSGPCMDALELAYQAHGLEPSDGLRDLADHAARQLECLGWLCAKDDGSAAEFARLCLVGAMPRLAAQLAASAPESPYATLAELASRALQCYAADAAAPASPKPNLRHDMTRGVWRHCSGCGKPYAREKEISIMALALARAGLPSDHLAQCPDCRDKAQGFFHRDIV